MRDIGTELIKHIGRHWQDGYFKMANQLTDVTNLVPVSGNIHLYARDSGGTSQLFYKDSANVEHDLSGTGAGMSIGAIVVGGTPGDVLIVGAGPVLDQLTGITTTITAADLATKTITVTNGIITNFA